MYVDYNQYWAPNLGYSRETMIVYVEAELTDHPHNDFLFPKIEITAKLQIDETELQRKN